MILVAGATGVLGSEIVRRLVARGEDVRAMVRATSSPEKVEALQQAGVEIVRADLKDPQTLAAACAGVSAVISTVTTILTSQPGDSFEATDDQGNRSLIDAAKNAGASKFVFISFDTSQTPDAPLPRAKHHVEEHLKQSGLDFTILQPGLFQEIWLGPMLFADTVAGTAKVYGKGTEGIRYIAVMNPPSEKFPMRMTSPREYVRRMANASGKPADSETRQPASAIRPGDTGQAELR